MKTFHLKKIFILLLFVILYSCSDDNEKESKIHFLGYFEAIHCETNIPLDGNFDGQYSNDFLSEFLSHGLWYKPKLRVQKINENLSFGFNMPLMSRFPSEFDSNSTFILLGASTAKIDIHNFSIIDNRPLYNNDEPTNSKMMSWELIDNETIKVVFFHDQIYDILDEEWKSITINCTFKRYMFEK